MLDSAHAILLFMSGKTRKHLTVDRMFSNAIVRELEILGEAANNVSKVTQQLWQNQISSRTTH
jgi:uncharacterized protein with HEPN domain